MRCQGVARNSVRLEVKTLIAEEVGRSQLIDDLICHAKELGFHPSIVGGY